MNIKIIVTFFYFLFLTISILIFIYILILNNAIYFFERRRCKYKQLWACTLSLYQEQISLRTSAELSLSVWFSLPAPMISIEQDSPHFIDVGISQHSISEWDWLCPYFFLPNSSLCRRYDAISFGWQIQFPVSSIHQSELTFAATGGNVHQFILVNLC